MLITSIFSFSKTNFSFSVTFILLSANAFNLDLSKILLYGKVLIEFYVPEKDSKYRRMEGKKQLYLRSNNLFCQCFHAHEMGENLISLHSIFCFLFQFQF